jgi:eukaryotic-like serine/threonine-protein kinase
MTRTGAQIVVLAMIPIILALVWLLSEGTIDPSDESASRPSADWLQGGEDWAMYRGSPALTGVAPGRLWDRLSLRWRFETGAAVRSSPVIVNGKVFVGSDDGKLYALDLRDGHQLWAFTTSDAIEATPLVLDGVVYAGSSNGKLYAIDVATGEPRWEYATRDRILGAANHMALPGKGSGVLVGGYDNRMHCVDIASGKAAWKYETENFVNGTPAVADGRIVFGGCDEKIHVLSAADGTVQRSVNVGSYVAGSAALSDGRAYVGHYAGEMLCVDVTTGEIVWRHDTDGEPVFSSPAVDAGHVVFGCRDHRVYCLARDDGHKIWTFPTRGNVDSSPVICGNRVVVGSDDGRLYLIDLVDGHEVASWDLGEAIGTSPAVSAPAIVVGCEDGFLYAFGPPPDETEVLAP